MIRFNPRNIGLPAIAAVILLAANSPAGAQSATEAARTLVDTLSPKAAATAELDRQLAQMRSGSAVRTMLSANPRIRAELAKNSPAIEAGLARMGAIQADAIGPILREMQESGRNARIAAFAENFTVEELREITAFYRTPAGAKLLARQGTMAADVARSNSEKFQARMRSAEQSIAPQLDQELRKLFPDMASGK